MSKPKIVTIIAVIAIACMMISYAYAAHCSLPYDTVGYQLMASCQTGTTATYHTFSTRPTYGRSGAVLEVWNSGLTVKYTSYTFPYFTQVPDFKYTQAARTERYFTIRSGSSSETVKGVLGWTVTK